MSRKIEKGRRTKAEFTSFNDYLDHFYPDKPRDDSFANDPALFGKQLAQKSLKLMRELLSEKKMSCVGT